jgi:hypothetical protein
MLSALFSRKGAETQRRKGLFLSGFAPLREQFLKLDSSAKIVSTQGF